MVPAGMIPTRVFAFPQGQPGQQTHFIIATSQGPAFAAVPSSMVSANAPLLNQAGLTMAQPSLAGGHALLAPGQTLTVAGGIPHGTWPTFMMPTMANGDGAYMVPSNVRGVKRRRGKKGRMVASMPSM